VPAPEGKGSLSLAIKRLKICRKRRNFLTAPEFSFGGERILGAPVASLRAGGLLENGTDDRIS
jgi:hypothetical protein